MVRDLLVRGMLVGVVAGLLSFGFLKVYGEPQVDRAIAFEAQKEHAEADKPKAADTHSHEAHSHGAPAPAAEPQEVVSRPIQAGIGLFTGVVVYCAAFGGLFALAFAFAHGRVPGPSSPQGVAALLAGAAFVAVYLVPSLKYPANPPAVGEAETIGLRTALYLVMIAASIAAMVVSIGLRSRLLSRLGEWNATLAACAAYVVLVTIAAVLLPSFDEVPEHFPAAVLWKFRIASIGAQLIMWTTIGLLFGALTQRAWAAAGARS
jgi:predicted cobalt transporter CbtA